MRTLQNQALRHCDEICVALLAGSAALAVHLLSGLHFPNDDQFITFRYIDHIAAGKGFVYNIGEHVLGTTTPLFTLLGALIKMLLPAVPTPDLMAYVNTVLLATGSVLFFWLLKAFVPRLLALSGALVFAFDLAKAVPEGMESPLFIVMVLSFLLALTRERQGWSAVFLALACLTRPDAGLIAVLAFIFWWQEGGFSQAMKNTAIASAVALPWLIFAFWYFGSVIPQSLIAKAHGHDLYVIPAIQAFKVQLAALSRIYWGSVFDPDNLILQTLANLLPFLALASAGAWGLVRRGFWILPAIPALYFVSYSITDPILFPWYSTQMEPLWITMSWVGLAWLLSRIPWRALRVGLLVVLLAGPILFWIQLVTSDDPGSKGGFFTIGQYLAAHAKPGESIAISNIGIVGYTTDAPIIDTIGLTYPESSAFYPWTDSCRDMTLLYQIPPALIQALVPDWLVAADGEMTPCFEGGAWFKAHYQPAWVLHPSGTVVWHRVMP